MKAAIYCRLSKEDEYQIDVYKRQSLGWYCQIYDSDYMSYANGPIPEQVMTKYIPGAVENPQGVFTNLIDCLLYTSRCV